MEEIVEPYEAQINYDAHYFKDENNIKHVNEYEIKEKIGEEGTELIKGDYAAKIFHKATLASKKIAVYEAADQPTITDLLEEQQYEHNPKILDFLKQKYFENKTEFATKYSELESLGIIIFEQVIKGIQHLHEKSIIHRDIKIDNILCKPSDEAAPIKLSDFTTSRAFQPGSKLYDIAGTPGFRAPELMYTTEEGYDPLPLDIWSLGICMFVFFNGKLPFYAETEIEMDILAKKEPIQFNQEKFQNKELVELIEGMVKKQPEERFTLDQVNMHSWFLNNL